ncbi:MAG TPA: YceD family protein [Streptosporangiaceae bacterium]|nr:YceD family protein [Streptosporangiaceae bacterium]
MPHSRTKHPKGPDLRNPLVFDTRDLVPGAARTLTRTVPAPPHMGVELARVPAGAELGLEIQLEGVTEGVLVTATVTGPLAGECARCLEAFSTEFKVRFQELFVLAADAEQADGAEADDSYLLDASGLLDIEPAVRDAIVLELPLSPLCEDSCQGLCVECGVRLADAEPGHKHEQRGTMWAALKDFRAEQADGDEPAGGPAEQGVPDGNAGPARTTNRADAVPDQLKEQ